VPRRVRTQSRTVGEFRRRKYYPSVCLCDNLQKNKANKHCGVSTVLLHCTTAERSYCITHTYYSAPVIVPPFGASQRYMHAIQTLSVSGYWRDSTTTNLKRKSVNNFLLDSGFWVGRQSLPQYSMRYDVLQMIFRVVFF
jgi:hypothetical protein